MPRFFLYFSFVASAFLMTACRQRPVRTAGQTAAQPWISGLVTAIHNGKDGYTATLQTADGKIYKATISRANLRDPKQYRSVQTGDQLSVQGDHWTMDAEKQITVRAIR